MAVFNILSGTQAVYFSPSGPGVSISGTLAAVPTTGSGDNMYEETGNWQRVLIAGSQIAASLTVNAPTTGTFQVFLPDTGHELGTIRGNTNTLTVFLPDTGHELGTIRGNTNTLTIFLPDTGHELGTIRGNTNTLTVFIPDTGHTLGKVDAGVGTFNVQFDPGHTLGNIATLASITNSIAIHHLSTGGTLAVKIDPGYNVVNASSTILLPSTASGSTSTAGGSGANTVVAPEASRNIKIYAYAITTTGIVSISPRFTTGGSGGATELWRVALQAPASVATGANLAVQPPGYLFATGSGNTLALYLDSATLVHYSVAYYKESS